MDYLLKSDTVGNYDAAWNSREEKLKFLTAYKDKPFAETVNNILVQYFGTSGTGKNLVSCYTMSRNGLNCYLELKGDFKTKAYEETKASKSNAILQSGHYDVKRKFTL